MLKKTAQLTGHNASVFALCRGTEPQTFLSGAGDGWMVQWKVQEPEMGQLLAKTDAQIFSMIFLPEQQKIVAGDMNGGVHWVDFRQPERTRDIAHHGKGVFGVLHVGDFVFTIGGDGILTKWSANEGRSLESLHLSNQSLRSIDYSKARNELAIGGSDNNIYLLDAGTFDIRQTLAQAHDNSVFAVRYHPNGQLLLSGGRDAHLKVWDLNDLAQPVSSQPAHLFTINDICFPPEAVWFATASRDKTIKIWDAQSFQLLKVLDTIRNGGHVNSVNALLYLAESGLLVSCSDDRSIILWEVGGDTR
ncbi:MAG: WD40 repeat domain-containing protein [Saprospiraceae bacterium]|nr:WD40 repeat domain-containing protein [Saprospiraceae bacterium]MDZ4706564.1 WD40 repeat domain-containing protein [Saprospiraceae bacterium]